MTDVLEPFTGSYDWDLAFDQNPGEPVYEVSDMQRRRVHVDGHQPGAVAGGLLKKVALD